MRFFTVLQYNSQESEPQLRTVSGEVNINNTNITHLKALIDHSNSWW